MKKICFIATNYFAIENFLKNIILETYNDYKIFIICSNASKLKKIFKKKNITFHNINIDRKINFLSDLKSLVAITKILKKEKIDIAHSIMPKTGLLVSLAGILAGTEIRIHTFTGQVWCNFSFFKKFFFKKIDELIISLNSYNFVDSFSQKKFLEKNLRHRNKLKVIGNGSISGFDLEMFKKKNLKYFFVKNKTITILFVGRITKDKGIFNLIEAYEDLKNKYEIRLIIGGNIDDTNIKKTFFSKIKKNKILWFKDKLDIQRSYLISDIFCLPSYREGFGNSVIEANIAKLPVLITNIYGFGDIIENKLYSRTCLPGDIDDLKKNLEIIFNNIKSYKIKSNKKFLKVKSLYNKNNVIKEYTKFYKNISNEKRFN